MAIDHGQTRSDVALPQGWRMVREGAARLAFGDNGGEIGYRVPERAAEETGDKVRAVLTGGFSLLFLCWREGRGTLTWDGGERIGFEVVRFRGTELDVVLERLPPHRPR